MWEKHKPANRYTLTVGGLCGRISAARARRPSWPRLGLWLSREAFFVSLLLYSEFDFCQQAGVADTFQFRGKLYA